MIEFLVILGVILLMIQWHENRKTAKYFREDAGMPKTEIIRQKLVASTEKMQAFSGKVRPVNRVLNRILIALLVLLALMLLLFSQIEGVF